MIKIILKIKMIDVDTPTTAPKCNRVTGENKFIKIALDFDSPTRYTCQCILRICAGRCNKVDGLKGLLYSDLVFPAAPLP